MTSMRFQGLFAAATDEAAMKKFNGSSKVHEIAELNKKYAVVLEGGKVRVLTFSEQHGRELAHYLTFSDFRNLLMNKFVVVGQDSKGNDICEPLGKFWLSHPARKQYDGVVFE